MTDPSSANLSSAAGPASLDGRQLRRYGRQMVLPEIGLDGQKKLRAARVLVIGMGGLGCPAALYLTAAGVGTLGLVDFDRVEESNLHRQVLYNDSDVGRLKVDAAAERLTAINPHVRLERHPRRLDRDNALELIEAYDLVLDGSDNAATRFLVNDACLVASKPLVWGAVLRFEGQISVFGLAGGPCYRCLFPEPPAAGSVPSCAEGGVLGALPGMIGSLQAMEAIKLIVGAGEALAGRFITFDALGFRPREIRLPRDPQCPACGDHATGRLRDAYEPACAPAADSTETGPAGSRLTKDPPMTIDPSAPPAEIDVQQLHAWRQDGTPHSLLDVREPHELEICRIEGADAIPMGQVPKQLDDLPRDRPLVVQCHLGGRSGQVVAFLRARGFTNATNLAGGIEAWSRQIDPSVPRY